MNLSDLSNAVAAAQLGLALAPGRGVFDSETGQDGVILAGRVLHAVAALAPARPPAGDLGVFRLPAGSTRTVYSVRLADGAIVERDPAQVLAYPAELRAAIEEFEA